MRVRSQDWWERVVLREFSDQESSKVQLRTTADAISKVKKYFNVQPTKVQVVAYSFTVISDARGHYDTQTRH